MQKTKECKGYSTDDIYTTQPQQFPQQFAATTERAKTQKSHLEFGLLSLCGLVDERLVNVRDHTTSSNCSLDQSVQFFVTPDGQLQVAWCNTLDLQILTGISSQLQDFSSKVFQDCRCVDSGGSSNTVTLVDRVLKETVNTTDRELKTSFGTSRLGSLLASWGFATLSTFSAFSSFSRLQQYKTETGNWLETGRKMNQASVF